MSNTFDAWWDYHNSAHKNWATTPEQGARWAWKVQESKIDELALDILEFAKLLGIEVNDKSIKDVRIAIYDTLKSKP